MSKERAQRRAARLADTQRRLEAEERQAARRGRWRALRSGLVPRRRRIGKLPPRYGRTQLRVVVFVLCLLVAGSFYPLDSWPVRVAVLALALIGLPALLTITYDRSTR